jgi:hypothetical protein
MNPQQKLPTQSSSIVAAFLSSNIASTPILRVDSGDLGSQT